MTSEHKNEFEQRLGIASNVTLRDDNIYPASFTIEEGKNIKTFEIISVPRALTRREGRKGKEKSYWYFTVKTAEGDFELKQNPEDNSWTVIGKLKK